MTIEEFMERNGIESENDMPQYLEPWDTFSGGIIGLTDDNKHIIYGYYKLADALASQYEADWRKNNPNKEPSEDDDDCDFYTQAIEWIDYNTLGSMVSLKNEFRPFVITEMEDY